MTLPDEEKQSMGLIEEPRQKKVFKHWGELTEHLEILLRQKVFILLFVFSAAIGALIISFIVSEKYEASASVYYRPMENVMLRFRSTESLGAPMPTPPFKIIVQTFNDAVRSEALLRPIVEKLHLEKRVQKPEGLRGLIWSVKRSVKEEMGSVISFLKYGRVIREDPVTSEILRLSNNVKIASKRDSYVFTLTVRYTDPVMAAAIADALGKNMVAWLREQDVMRAEERLTALKEQLEKKMKYLTALREEKQTLLSNNQVVSVGEETSKGVENLYSLELESVRLGSLVGEKQKKLAELDEKLKSRQYAQPEDLKKIRSEKTFETIDLAGLLERKRTIDTERSSLKTRLQQLPPLQKQLENADVKMKTASADYQQVAELFLETQQRVQGQVGEMRMMMSPSVPAAPVQPIRLYYISATMFAAFITAVTLVYLFNYFNIRVFFYSRGYRDRKTMPETSEGAVGHAL